MTTPGPSLPVAAVARRLGVAPATLRTWDRRYGLGPSEHTSGAHRRYAPVDVARLERMMRLTQQGVSPAEAAHHALAHDPQARPAVLDIAVAGRTDRVRGHGGTVLALPGAEAVVRGVGRAAMALDSETVSATIREQVMEHGVLYTWEHMLRPVLAAAGERWATTGESVEVEHLLSDCVISTLRSIAASLPTMAPPRPVLLASAPEEQHALPLHAIAAGLAERGIACRVLGAAMPVSALEGAVRRTGACVLFLWSQLAGTGRSSTLDALPLTRPATLVVVGGPGWARAELPDRTSYAGDLNSAVDLVAQASGN